MRRTRVAILHNLPSPYRLPLFRALAADRSLRLRVFFMASSAPNRTWRAPEDLGFDAVWLGSKALRLPGQEYRPVMVSPGVVAALSAFRPDAVILGGYDSVTALAALGGCRLAGVPAILWSGSTALESSGRRRLTTPLKRAVVAACAAFIAYGSRARDYLVSLGAAPDLIAIAPNTVDIEYFRRQAASADRARERQRLGLEADVPAVLFAGQFLDRKDPLALLHGLRAVADRGCVAQALFVGDGPLRAAIATTAEELGVPVRVQPGVPAEAMPRVYAAADMLALPSREEIWGLVANEAMACGLPVIISNACGAAADLVEDGMSGLVVPPGDVGRLADAIEALVADAEIRRAMGQAAAQRVGCFSIEREAAGFLRAVEIARRRDRSCASV
jgi:glycosyltransferase involved in cell wall biosynthesis